MTILYFLMFSLCFGGFFYLTLSQTSHAKTVLGRPVQHPTRLRLAGAILHVAALVSALASPHPAATSTSWFGRPSIGAALCTVTVYLRGRGTGKEDKRSYD